MTRDEYIALHATSGILGDDNNKKAKLAHLAGIAYDALKFKGAATGAAIELLGTTPENGDTYSVITTGAALTAGTITVLVGDMVCWDEPNSVWVFLVSGAATNV